MRGRNIETVLPLSNRSTEVLLVRYLYKDGPLLCVKEVFRSCIRRIASANRLWIQGWLFTQHDLIHGFIHDFIYPFADLTESGYRNRYISPIYMPWFRRDISRGFGDPTRGQRK